jgi:hypothetical protein
VVARTASGFSDMLSMPHSPSRCRRARCAA